MFWLVNEHCSSDTPLFQFCLMCYWNWILQTQYYTGRLRCYLFNLNMVQLQQILIVVKEKPHLKMLWKVTDKLALL